MNWLVPSIIATLCGTVLLSGVFWYLYATYRHTYLRLWSLSWICYALRLVAMLIMVSVGRDPVLLFAHQSMSLLSGTFLLAGVLSFVGKRFSPLWWAATAAGIGYIAVAIPMNVSFAALTLPTFSFLTIVTVWAGIKFLQQSRVRGLGSVSTGWGLILWGIHKANYPWLGDVAWFAPWGYLIGAVLAFVVALGILLTYFEALKEESEATARNYRTLFDSAPYGIAVADPATGILLEVNQALAEMSGRSREELVGQHQRVLHPPQEVDERGMTKSFRRHIQQDLRNTLLAQMAMADGVIKDVEIKSDKALLDGREVFQGFFNDVTERLAAERALSKQKHLLEKSQEMGKIGTWELDITENRLVWTDENCRIFGVPEGSVVDYKLFLGRVHPEDRDFVNREWMAALDGKPYDLEHRILLGDQVRWVREKAELHYDSDGKAVSAIGFTQDITERKLFEAERQRLDAQLRETQKLEAIGTLAGGVAHDFNNILGAILGYSELVLSQLPPGSELAEDVTEVVRAGERARELVKQILAFSRRSEQARRPIEAHLVVSEAMRLLRQTLPSSIPIELAIAKQDDLVLADPTQIHQVVMNLCTNAYHAMRAKGGTLGVRLEAIVVDAARSAAVPDLKQGPYVHLAVSDTGTGMDPVTLSRVFEPFFTTKPQGEGTGMGLAVVHGIVRSHDGAIQIESRIGQGTQVHVYLPRYFGDRAQEAAAEVEPPRGKGQILVVDDEPALARMIEKMLTSLGYRVVAVSTSNKALELFRGDPDAFDLVVTDQTMPGMTGATLAGEMLKLRPNLPVVLCTGYSETVNEERARTIGIRSLLYKPLTRAALSEAVRAALEKTAKMGVSGKHD